MIQIIVLLAVSWLALWLFDKSGIQALGLTPERKRLAQALTLFVLTAVCGGTAFLFRTWLAKETYTLNPGLNMANAWNGIWDTLRGVLTEELICRGALLYILVKKLGTRPAILVTAMLFGVLHWLNGGVWGNPVQMAIVFGFTFFMGLLLAFAYTRTGSLLAPIAIHLGWNLVQNFVLPGGPVKESLFVLAVPPPEVTISYTAFLLLLLFPKISALALNYLLLRKMPS